MSDGINRSINRTSVGCPACGKGSHCRVFLPRGIPVGTMGKGLYCKKQFQVVGEEVIQKIRPVLKELR